MTATETTFHQTLNVEETKSVGYRTVLNSEENLSAIKVICVMSLPIVFLFLFKILKYVGALFFDFISLLKLNNLLNSNHIYFKTYRYKTLHYSLFYFVSFCLTRSYCTIDNNDVVIDVILSRGALYESVRG